jgi:hypothetical protein
VHIARQIAQYRPICDKAITGSDDWSWMVVVDP